jgi:beta-aspartyl-peptidase (threonine type)
MDFAGKQIETLILHLNIMDQKFGIAIHGGAGTPDKQKITEQAMRDYKLGLAKALDAGLAVLRDGGPAVLAVEEAVIALENNPLFNAGKGSVLNSDREHDMDAAIMDGSSLSAGAVAGVRGLKNPIRLARKIMESGKYVFLHGAGAIEFGRQHKLEFEEPAYFKTPERVRELEEVIKEENDGGKPKKFGTVGAVALDKHGNLAAATSTGGLTNKKFGRLGDTPVIGSGTYANNDSCAVSCTGNGEEFIRAVVAYDISCLIEYKGLTLQAACREVMQGKLNRIQGSGGLIAIDRLGNVELPFNTEGMYRAYLCGNGKTQIGIFRE